MLLIPCHLSTCLMSGGAGFILMGFVSCNQDFRHTIPYQILGAHYEIFPVWLFPNWARVSLRCILHVNWRINFNFTSYFPFALSRKICMYQPQRQLGVRNLQILQT